jgi:DNA-binding transcriptional regulator YiaG
MPRVYHRAPVAERFWAHVDRRSLDECWPWLAALRKGYGTFKLAPGDLETDRRRDVYAHRVAFRLVHDRWPEPEALHGCDNPVCCNAENSQHIHEGTPQSNMDEKMARGRHRGAAPGVLNHNSKLTQEQINEVRRLAQAGVSQRTIGTQFGVAQPTVSRIVRGQRHREEVVQP